MTQKGSLSSLRDFEKDNCGLRASVSLKIVPTLPGCMGGKEKLRRETNGGRVETGVMGAEEQRREESMTQEKLLSPPSQMVSWAECN